MWLGRQDGRVNVKAVVACSSAHLLSHELGELLPLRLAEHVEESLDAEEQGHVAYNLQGRRNRQLDLAVDRMVRRALHISERPLRRCMCAVGPGLARKRSHQGLAKVACAQGGRRGSLLR
jgi:hypothetical protein